MLLFVDAFFRFSGVGLILLVAVMAIKDLPRSASFYLLLVTNLCMVGFFLGYAPVELQLPLGLRAAFRVLDAFLLVSVWLFVLSLFQKDFRLNWFHFLTSGLVGASMLAERLVQFDWLDNLPLWWAGLVNSLALLLLLHMVIVALGGRRDDLLEKRRKSRLYLTFIIIASAFLAIILGSVILPQQQATVNVITLWPSIIGICFWLMSIKPEAFTFDSASHTKQLSARDSLLQDQLTTTMVDNQAYLENNLSLENLAKRLGVAPHRLRSFINQKLGHTNFSNYINRFRVEAVKAALASPKNDHVPILTIALNHGFNSLPPFNRAFKKQEGLTPSAFRKKLRK